MSAERNRRASHEVDHGRWLAQGDPELLWGWGTPAGRLRARRRAQLIIEGARIGPGSRVLEIGCGTGMFTALFAETGAHILGVDISPDLIARARERGLPPDRVEFLVKRFEECSLEGPFDAVIGSSVLHHLEIREALCRIFELLKPGGWLSFAEPNMLNPQIFVERTFRFLFPRISPDETAFVRSRLCRRLLDCGFRHVSIRPFDWLHPSTPRAFIPAVSTLGTWLENTCLIREFAGSLCICARRPASHAAATSA